MNWKRHEQNVLNRLVFLPGGVDRNGGVLLVLSSPFDEVRGSVAYEDTVSLLGLVAETIPPTSYFTVLLDSRHLNAKQLKFLLRATQQALYRKVRHVLIVQPEKFLEQQKISFDLILEGYEFKTTLISLHKLTKYVEISQLPSELGGTSEYDPYTWYPRREKISEALNLLSDLTSDPQRQDKEKLDEIDQFATKLAASKRVDEEYASKILKNSLANLKKKEERESSEELVEEHASGVHRFLDWIEGGGERWLKSLSQVCDNADEAEHVLKQHEQLEVKSKEIEEQAVQLAEMATRLMAVCPQYSISLHKMREQVNVVAEHFCKRVTAQSQFAQSNKTLQGQLATLAKHTDAILESLCQDDSVKDLDEASRRSTEIDEKKALIQKSYESAVKTGSETLKVIHQNENLLPADVFENHVKASLTYIAQRHNRCNELVNVKRLKLEQYIQLYTAEKDCDQVVTWLDEIKQTLAKDYSINDISDYAIVNLRTDRKQIEATVQSTYEYGKKLCRMGEQVGRSVKGGDGFKLKEKRLDDKFHELNKAIEENEERCRVVDSFNSTIAQMKHRVQELERRLREMLRSRKSSPSLLKTERGRLEDDIDELTRIAHLLSAQINADHNATVDSRQRTIAQITAEVEKVREVHRKMESLVREESSDEQPEEYIRMAPVNKDSSSEESPRSYASPRPLSNVVEETEEEAPTTTRARRIIINDARGVEEKQPIPTITEPVHITESIILPGPKPKPSVRHHTILYDTPTAIRLSNNESYL